MATVLIVEDEPKLAEALKDYLERDGYATHIIDDGLAVVPWVQAQSPAMILLDIMLPGKDGLDICREVRAFSNVPIIMVTARVDEIERLLGLELGADDYICKPYSPREVVARVKAVLRRTLIPAGGDAIAAAGFSINESEHTAALDGQALDLTRVELRLLQTLLNPPGRVWSRNDLLDRLYDDRRVVSDRTVDSHVKNLRRKLRAVRPDAECIRAVYGVGYKLET